MKFDNVFDVLGGIVILAIVTQIVTSPKTASQVKALGDAFTGSIKAATAQG